MGMMDCNELFPVITSHVENVTYLKSLEAELAHYRCMLEKLVCERTERLNQRLIILESCNSSLGDNYHKMHKMYLSLLIKHESLEAELGVRSIV